MVERARLLLCRNREEPGLGRLAVDGVRLRDRRRDLLPAASRRLRHLLRGVLQPRRQAGHRPASSDASKPAVRVDRLHKLQVAQLDNILLGDLDRQRRRRRLAAHGDDEIGRISEVIELGGRHALDPPLHLRGLDNDGLLASLLRHCRVVLELQARWQPVCHHAVGSTVRRHVVPQFGQGGLEVLSRPNLNYCRFDNRAFVRPDLSVDRRGEFVAALHRYALTDVDDDAVLGDISDHDRRRALASTHLRVVARIDDGDHRRLARAAARHDRYHRLSVGADQTVPVEVNRHRSDVVRQLDRQARRGDVVGDRHRPAVLAILLNRHRQSVKHVDSRGRIIPVSHDKDGRLHRPCHAVGIGGMRQHIRAVASYTPSTLAFTHQSLGQSLAILCNSHRRAIPAVPKRGIRQQLASIARPRPVHRVQYERCRISCINDKRQHRTSRRCARAEAGCAR